MNNLLVCCLLGLLTFYSVQADHEKTKHAAHHPVFEEHFKNGAHNPEFDHLAILGSKKAEEEFDELEPEEAKDRLAELIPKMDLNKDGKLVLPELQSWVFNSYKSLDSEEAKEEFKTIDLDENGRVTWEEYLKKVYSYTPQELDEIAKKNDKEMKEVERMIGEDKDKFALADRSKDNALNINEFPAFVHPHDYEYMHDLEVKHALADHDKDKDGKISLAEFKVEPATPEHHDPQEEIAEEVKFNDYDTNKDGFLDEKEIKAWILPNTMQNAKEEAEHLINDADADHDGVLTEEEILNSYDTFVGSQATDYGRHLHLVREEL